MWWLWLLLVVLLGGIGFYLFRPQALGDIGSRRAENARQMRRAQGLIRTPDDLDGMGDVRALTLKVPQISKACNLARSRANQTFRVQDAPPLPFPECREARCECSYYAVSGHRSGKEQRSGEDRRESTRFEPDKTDRRKGRDRRRGSDNPWRGRA